MNIFRKIDRATWDGNEVGRVEVTATWFWENGVDHDLTLWVWIPDQSEFGLDPWRIKELDEVKSHHRLFVQKDQLLANNINIPEIEE